MQKKRLLGTAKVIIISALPLFSSIIILALDIPLYKATRALFHSLNLFSSLTESQHLTTIWTIGAMIGLISFTVIGLALQAVALEEGGAALRRLNAKAIKKYVKLSYLLPVTLMTIVALGMLNWTTDPNAATLAWIHLLILLGLVGFVGTRMLLITDSKILFSALEKLLYASAKDMSEPEIVRGDVEGLGEDINLHHEGMLELVDCKRWKDLDDHLKLHMEVLSKVMGGDR